MKKRSLAILVLLLASSWVLGDGIGFKGDRVDGHTTTVIKLTEEQRAILDAKPKGKEKSVLRLISLTSEQKTTIGKEAGFAPEKLEVWPLSAAKDTCTCFLLNIGIRFKSDKLEVPHFLLGKDFDDSRKSKKDREKEKQSSEQKDSGERRDTMHPGVIGGIVGSMLGIAGGVVGTYFGIRNTKGPRERAFMVKASVVCWIAIVLFLTLMFGLPNPYRYLLWIPYAILLPCGIIFGNRTQHRIRKEESQNKEVNATR